MKRVGLGVLRTKGASRWRRVLFQRWRNAHFMNDMCGLAGLFADGLMDHA
ncbi:hypothetical protein KFU94_17440 [Chloroflexi bacterium TSY]|nr:hypothetical protein [Chloroflexi bacterium TSY]